MTDEMSNAKIRDINVATEDDAEKIRQFAVGNADFLASNLAKITGAIIRHDLETATVGFSFCMACAYASGVADGMKKQRQLSEDAM